MSESKSNTQVDIQENINAKQVNRLGTAKISRLLLEFAIPSIIGLVVNGLYNLVDSIFLGHGVGEVGLATATVAMPTMIFSMAMGVLIGAGGNALAALKLGEGKHDDAEKVLGNAFTLTVVAAVVCMLLVNVFMDPVLRISGATEVTWEHAHTFVRIISFGFILQFFGMGFNNFIRTAGDPNRALYTMVAGTVLCIILNYLFVIVFKWGIAGSAWATVIGQALSAGLVLWYFAFSRKAPFKLKRKHLPIVPRLVGSIFALGSASFVLQIAAAILNLILNNQLVYYGGLDPIGAEGAQAAIGVVQRVAMFAFFPILGVAMAAAPLFGYNYGAQNFVRVRSAILLSMAWVAAIGVFFWILIHLFPEQICIIFGIKDELLLFTIDALKVQVFFMPLVGLQVVAANYFQSSGQPLKSMFLSLTRQLLYLIPLLYLLPLLATHLNVPGLSAMDSPLEGLYYAFPIADILSIVTAGTLMLLEFRKLGRRISLSTQIT
ncbi:MAG: MATE family efflux transporter [Coriobacteriales bacterium]|jgi:putative MATE family efflux protein|nr:MATE family efflux transporter [Coriobacteriales bacterium]